MTSEAKVGWARLQRLAALSALLLTGCIPQAHSAQLCRQAPGRPADVAARTGPARRAAGAPGRRSAPIARSVPPRRATRRRTASSKPRSARSAARSTATSASRCATSTAAGRPAGTAAPLPAAERQQILGRARPRSSGPTPASSTSTSGHPDPRGPDPVPPADRGADRRQRLHDDARRPDVPGDHPERQYLQRRGAAPRRRAGRGARHPARHRIEGIRFGPGERLMQSQIAGIQWQPSYFGRPLLLHGAQRVPAERRRAAFERYIDDPIDGATPKGSSTPSPG